MAVKTPVSLASSIDHTILHATATAAEVEQVCREARAYGFAAVCVNPVWVSLAARELEGAAPKVATVVGFPLGAATAVVKATEAEDAVARGAEELDVVAWIGGIRGGSWGEVEKEIRHVLRAVDGRALVKVILETAALDAEQIVRAAELCRAAGVDFVKTSTGFHPAGGASPDAVTLLRRVVGPDIGVKAAGGIRTREQALSLIAAGANRIGTSRGPALIDQPASEQQGGGTIGA